MHYRKNPQRLIFTLLITTALALTQAARSQAGLLSVIAQASTSGIFSAGLSGAAIGDNGASITATATDSSTSTIRFSSLASQINVTLNPDDSTDVQLGELLVTSNSNLPLTQAPNFGGARFAVTVNFTSPSGTTAQTFSGVLTGRIAASSAAAEIQWLSPLSHTFMTGSGEQLKLTIEPTTFLNQAPTSVTGNLNVPIKAQLLLVKANTPPSVLASTPTIAQGSAAFVPVATVSDQETAAGNLMVSASSLSPGLLVSRVINNNGAISVEVRAACDAPVTTSPGPGLQLTVQDGDGATTVAQVAVRYSPNPAPTLGGYSAVSLAAGASAVILPGAPPVDNGVITGISAAAPGFGGTLSVSQGSGAVSISNATPTGNFTVTVTATDNCGATVSRSFALAVGQTPPIADPSFSAVSSQVSGTSVDTTTAADFTQDGITDVATLDSVQTGAVSVLPGNNNGSVGAPIKSGAGSLNAPVEAGNIQADANTLTPVFEARDFNGDGKPDLLITSGNNIIVLIGRGDGSFNAPQFVTAEGRDYAGDFNQDGLADLVKFNFDAATMTGSISVQLSRADGTFSDPVTTLLETGNGLSAQAGKFGDFNGDGRPDFAAITDRSQYSNGQLVTRNFQVSIFLGNANGQFDHSQEISSGTYDLDALIVGDFNQDGLSDVVTTSPDSGAEHFLYLSNRQSGLLLAGSLAGALPAVFRVGDFNADGRADLAFVTSDGVTIRSGDENRVFSQEVRLNVKGGLNVGDFNHDGRTDLIVTDSAASAVRVLLSNAPANDAPVITAAAPLTRQPGSAGQTVTIATVSDTETPAGNLTVSVASAPAGIIVSGITNNNGTITASVAAECSTATGANQVVLRVTDGGGLSSTAALTVNVGLSDVTAQVSFLLSGLIYDRAHRTFNGTVTITSISSQPITGPLRLELTGLNGSVGLVNATSLRCSTPFITLSNVTAIAPGQSVVVPVIFSNPGNILISFTPQLHNSNLFVPIENLPPPLADNRESQTRLSPGRIRRPPERRVR